MKISTFIIFIFLTSSCSTQNTRSPSSIFKSCYKLYEEFVYRKYELPDTSSKSIYDDFIKESGNLRLESILSSTYKRNRNNEDVLLAARKISHSKANRSFMLDTLVDARLTYKIVGEKLEFEIHSIRKRGLEYGETQHSIGTNSFKENLNIANFFLSMIYASKMIKQEYPQINKIHIMADSVVNPELALQLSTLGFVNAKNFERVSEEEIRRIFKYIYSLPKRPIKPKRENYDSDSDYARALSGWKRGVNRWRYRLENFFNDLELKEGENTISLITVLSIK